jgi:hypothetical protein
MTTITSPIPTEAVRSAVHADSALSNAPAAAALLAAGIGSAVLGIMTVLDESSPKGKLFDKWLNWYPPVGPLSGKTLSAVIAYALSWVLLAVLLRGKSVRLGRWIAATFALVGVGLLCTFPEFFDLFAPKQ